MGLTEPQVITIAEYNKLRENSEGRLEYIDGIVYMTPSPSTKHQRISGRLQARLFNFLEGKECEVFTAPFDIELRTTDPDQGDQIEKTKVVIPDLSVICDKTKLGENKYAGSPELIVEILSPSNQAHDLVKKLNLYMQSGVKEYWIVNPLLNTVQIYGLNEEGQYQQLEVLKETGVAHSEVLQGFSMNLEELFK
ncbi:Uma2 family endonuclease [Desulfosporosinus sp. PR]|uniref:Uma2 family endonuclease n=1 Tax=Candidatus Desulfosporosinus nitrosoreducens TaxID=3401928 RepID=UPI0027F88E85|nr:Uma2 family endonuclease [Desulfosporosinus sp. PR]MDQ7095443.1 Uma2 family endonuclease [Desulfosporosinus sp. PR]